MERVLGVITDVAYIRQDPLLTLLMEITFPMKLWLLLRNIVIMVKEAFITFILSTYEESLGTYSLADGLKLLQIFFFPSSVGVGGWVGTLCSTLFWSQYLSTLHNYLKLEYMVIHLLLMTRVFFFKFWLSMLEFRVGVVLIVLYKLLYHGSDSSITLAFMSLHTGTIVTKYYCLLEICPPTFCFLAVLYC